jgi:hypothetical protein
MSEVKIELYYFTCVAALNQYMNYRYWHFRVLSIICLKFTVDVQSAAYDCTYNWFSEICDTAHIVYDILLFVVLQ